MAVSGFLASIGRLFSRDNRLSEEESEALIRSYLARCENFRLLLAANNKALGSMAVMEELARGERTFGMAEVRALSVEVCASVFRMIKHMCALAPGRYDVLFERLAAVRSLIDKGLSLRDKAEAGPLVLDVEDMEASMAGEVGSKMANLGEAKRLGLAVPPGFAVTASAYRLFMQESDLRAEIDRLIQSMEAREPDEMHRLSSALQQSVLRAGLPGDLARALDQGVERLAKSHGGDIRLALRSSALGEDASGACFAGQYRTVLNVEPEHAVHAYKEVAASKYGVAAMAYRRARGIRDEDVDMCVGCLAMVDARAGGVVYTGNPIDLSDNSVAVHAVPGLPVGVVDGSAATDVFMVSRDPLEVRESRVAAKASMMERDPLEGLVRVDLDPEQGARPSLDPDQVLAAAAMALRLEAHFGGPQDVEFAVDGHGRLVLLQCRPLHVLEAASRAPEDDSESLGDVLARGGTAAGPGVACGPAFVVRKDVDGLIFPEGSVLVAELALPKWAPLLGRAAAVVTAQGGPAGHLANVAREFGLPALFGLEKATALLDGAGEVTVDADNGVVFRGRVEEVLERRGRKPLNLMRGSPVHGTLLNVAAQVVPLNLLDPEGDDFRPENCRTLHDITRFCHEKAVWEMFESGGTPGASGLEGKRLTYQGRPLNYWAVDLGGGFRTRVTGAKVDIDQVDCPPFTALWRGMTAYPWEGPPGLDAGGFMSVLAGAGRGGPADPAAGGGMSLRNYVMISPEYVNLQSRFGYHFCTVEALVCDVAAENYATFQFKGGAADIERRILRAELVRDLLEARGFATERREDSLYARMEGGRRRAMEQGLAVLGYVLVHTRQTDMVMGNANRAVSLRRKMERDLDTLEELPVQA